MLFHCGEYVGQADEGAQYRFEQPDGTVIEFHDVVLVNGTAWPLGPAVSHDGKCGPAVLVCPD